MAGRGCHEEAIDSFVKRELSLNSITNTLVDREPLLHESFRPEEDPRPQEY